MDKTEKVFYLLLDGLLFLLVFLTLPTILDFNCRLFIGLVIAHTLHWLFNGHLYVLLKDTGHSKVNLNSFMKYAERLQKAVEGEKSVLAAAIFGSFSRGSLTECSDLDVRIIRRKGVMNGLAVCIFAFFERSKAFLNKFPLDIYVLDGFKSLTKLKSESPVILYDPQNFLASRYKKVFMLENIISSYKRNKGSHNKDP
jgi:predicted nucleotidyltransferase